MLYSVQKVFVAGASDVSNEQQIAIEVINTVSRVVNEPMQVFLEPYSWRHETPVPLVAESDPQGLFNERIAQSDIVIIIVGKRYGMGHTEEEAKLAIDLNRESVRNDGRPKPQILAFFKKLPYDDDPGSERQKADALKHSLVEDARVLPSEYETDRDFERELTHALYKSVIRFRHSTFKHKCLAAFWSLGVAEGHESHIDVVYPAVDDPQAAGYWRRRLLPNIVFDDSKAIQKIEKTLRLIGFRSFRFHNSTDIPDLLMYHNRVWLCLPRNRPAQRALEAYGDRCLFRMTAETRETAGRIHWRAPDATTFTHVTSPLRRYLELQRDAKTKVWHTTFRDVIAKDYGIISRFSVDSSFPTTDGKLREFFIAGIRGLGTWGAGWFLDRRYRSFLDYKPHEDIQLLVEVVYGDGRIRDVRDVSKEAQDYFDKQTSDDYIKNEIEAYRSHKMFEQ